MIVGAMNPDIYLSLVEPRDVTAGFGRLVRALRQKRRWTQQELASRAGVPATTLSRLERTGCVSTDRLAKVLFALDAIDGLHAFLEERNRLAALPDDLRAFSPGAPRPSRIRHARRKEAGA